MLAYFYHEDTVVEDAVHYFWSYGWKEDGWAEQFQKDWETSLPKDRIILLEDWMDGRTFLAKDLWDFVEAYSRCRYENRNCIAISPEYQWLCDMEADGSLENKVREEMADVLASDNLFMTEAEILLLILAQSAPDTGKLLADIDTYFS